MVNIRKFLETAFLIFWEYTAISILISSLNTVYCPLTLGQFPSKLETQYPDGVPFPSAVFELENAVTTYIALLSIQIAYLVVKLGNIFIDVRNVHSDVIREIPILNLALTNSFLMILSWVLYCVAISYVFRGEQDELRFCRGAKDNMALYLTATLPFELLMGMFKICEDYCEQLKKGEKKRLERQRTPQTTPVSQTTPANQTPHIA